MKSFYDKIYIYHLNKYESTNNFLLFKMEAEILSEIRDSEKKSDEIIERTKKESESILQDATRNSSKLLSTKEDEIRKLQDKKIMDFREKLKFVKEEKLAEGKAIVKQKKIKTEKNISKAVNFVLKKFEEMI